MLKSIYVAGLISSLPNLSIFSHWYFSAIGAHLPNQLSPILHYNGPDITDNSNLVCHFPCHDDITRFPYPVHHDHQQAIQTLLLQQRRRRRCVTSQARWCYQVNVFPP